MSASSQTLNSGAFRSLHCLIYKVLAAAPSVAEHLVVYHTFRSLSSPFFNFFRSFSGPHSLASLSRKAWLFYHISFPLSSTFFNFFKVFSALNRSQTPSPESLVSLPHSLPFVKPFFPVLGNFFPKPLKPAPLSDSSLTLPYPPLSCQYLFVKFFSLFSHFI